MVNRDKQHLKSLIRYVRVTYSLAWVGALEDKFMVYPRPSLKDLATVFPVDHDLKLERNGHDTDNYNASRTHWSRIRTGKIIIRENKLTKRVEQLFPQLLKIRQMPLWRLFENPLATSNQLKKILFLLEPTLGNKLFEISKERLGFSYKQLSGKFENYPLVESVSAFTLKLVLYRLRKLGEIGDEWPCDAQDLSLHLFRICARTPWDKIKDRIIRLFWIYIQTNKYDLISESDIKLILEDHPIDFIYQQIFERLHPDYENWITGYPTLDHYLKANQIMVQNFWDAYTPKCKGSPPLLRFSLEALYWADRDNQSWLTQNIPKEEVFIHNSTLLNEYCIRASNGSRKRIW